MKTTPKLNTPGRMRPRHPYGWALLVAALLFAGPAAAAEKTFRYFRFAPLALTDFGDGMQLSEFTFSRGGTLLNLNNRNGTGVNVVPVAITAGGQDVNGNEGPPKVADGLPLTSGGAVTSKWFTGAPFSVPLDFDFGEGTPATIDAYNFATANDSGDYGNRTPITWKVLGSNDAATWEILDTRANVAVNNANNTYQTGWTLPDTVTPLVTSFTLLNSDAEGTSGVVKNGQAVTLDWLTEYGDANGTTLTPLPGAVEVNGPLQVVPPSNATSPFVLTAARTAPALSRSETLNLRAVAGGVAQFQYVRFTITKRRPGNNIGLVQLSEFEFYYESNKLSGITVTNAGGSNAVDAGEGANKLVDGMMDTKWLDNNNQPVIFDFGAPVEFDGYLFVTGNDALDRDPVSWTLEGSNDQVTWTIVENINYTYPTPQVRNANSRYIPLPGSSLAPVIGRFTGDAPVLIAGEPLRLTWDTTLASSVSITPGVGVTTASGTITVSPAATTTYQLSATSATGFVSTATFQVQVIPAPAITAIAYDSFTGTGSELGRLRNAAVSGSRLRLVPEIQGQSGEAWFRKRQPVAAGFETTFGLSMNQTTPNPSFLAADGVAFVIQNHPAGSGAQAVTGEDGLTENALNIKFDTFGSADDASALEVRSGTDVLQRVILFREIGVELAGLFPGTATFNYTTATQAASPPYQIRVVYVPGNLDIYFNGIAVVQNLAVDLAAIGAVDANGTAYAGFSSRTGANVQNSDITNWHLTSGDFSAQPPEGLVKSQFRSDLPGGLPVEWSIVWNSRAIHTYRLVTSPNLVDWVPLLTGEPGIEGQTKLRVPLFDLGEKAWFRVEKEP